MHIHKGFLVLEQVPPTIVADLACLFTWLDRVRDLADLDLAMVTMKVMAHTFASTRNTGVGTMALVACVLGHIVLFISEVQKQKCSLLSPNRLLPVSSRSAVFTSGVLAFGTQPRRVVALSTQQDGSS